ncbi:MAG: epimerase, partial [Gemmatimonadaceae bacterium]|nr:epimerase [Gemmatimonadaceae bacterium]
LSQLLPYEALSLDELCEWTIAWIRADGRLLHKPTKFEVRDGRC